MQAGSISSSQHYQCHLDKHTHTYLCFLGLCHTEHRGRGEEQGTRVRLEDSSAREEFSFCVFLLWMWAKLLPSRKTLLFWFSDSIPKDGLHRCNNTYAKKVFAPRMSAEFALAENSVMVARYSPEDPRSTLLLFTLCFSFTKIIHSQQTFFKDAKTAEVDKRMSPSYGNAKMWTVCGGVHAYCKCCWILNADWLSPF